MKQLKGLTYPIKDHIKVAGGKWDKDTKTWSVPEEEYERLQSMIDAYCKPKTQASETSCCESMSEVEDVLF